MYACGRRVLWKDKKLSYTKACMFWVRMAINGCSEVGYLLNKF